MNTTEKLTALKTKGTLSALWIYVLLNMLFRDIHEMGRPGMLAEMMNSSPPEILLVVSAVVLQLLIGMVILTHLLPNSISRWANLVMGVVGIPLLLFSTMLNDADDYVFLGFELLAVLAVVIVAWRWRVPEMPSEPAVRSLTETA